MLKVVFTKTEEEAEKLVSKEIEPFPDALFQLTADFNELNNSDYFKKLLKEIDNCDIPMNNVVRDIFTGETHSFDKISTGVIALWLIYKDKECKYLHCTQWLGENCYQLLFDLGEEQDIYMYDDSEFLFEALPDLHGRFEDLLTGEIVQVEGNSGWMHCIQRGY